VKQRIKPRLFSAGGTDLAAVNEGWLIRKVLETRNTTPLIEHLRAGCGPMGADLRTLIADLLEGEVKATPKRKTLRDSGGGLGLRGACDFWKCEIREAIAEGGPRYKDLERTLKLAGFSGVAETKGQITAAAKCITQALYGITKDQLEGFLINRKRNAKLRTNKSREK
jgi:hypothetical protein